MNQNTVFISYRRDLVGKSFARLIERELSYRHYDVFLDVDCLGAGMWEDQIIAQIQDRAHFLLLLTPGALDRCADENDWVRREFLLAEKHGRNIVPVLKESVVIQDMLRLAHQDMQSLFEYQAITIGHETFPGDIEKLISRFIVVHKAPEESISTIPDFQIDTSHFDVFKYAPAELFGREDETRILNDAWNHVIENKSNRTNILVFVAFGGEGKTSLIAKWAADLAHRRWIGCEAVFAWSFYSQGTKEQTTASSDLFLKQALIAFGDAEMADSEKHVSEKGKRLAQLIGAKRALLILDGVEPLQYSPASPMRGKFRDLGIAALLKGLAAFSSGLCVVTTRYSIPDLKAHWQSTVQRKELNSLPKQAGVQLLKSFGVHGTQTEYEQLVEDVHGHALTINLLGSYLRNAHAGDIRKRDLVKLADADDEEQGGHAFRVLAAYVKWFETGGEDTEENERGQRALAVLRLLGLFDRPLSADCFFALLKMPVISNLTELLVEKNEAERNKAMSRLEDAKLLLVNRDKAYKLISMDTHPLLREYFAKQIRDQYPSSWREAHQRLYEHLKATKEGNQPTLEALQPLYEAVAHGCQAGMQRDAYETYIKRILCLQTQNTDQYSIKMLGAFGPDLSAVACFFEQPWGRVLSIFSEKEQAHLLNMAAFRLRPLGRLNEAVESWETGLKIVLKQKTLERDFEAKKLIANIKANLSEVNLTLGELTQAIKDAKQSVSYADDSDDAYSKMNTRTIYADALHQTGCRDEAKILFLAAETIQVEHQPKNPRLLSLAGFRYCDFILADVERAAWQTLLKCIDSQAMSSHLEVLHAVSQHMTQILDWAKKNKNTSLLSKALNHLTLGCSGLYQAILSQSKPSIQSEIAAAVDGFLRANTLHILPLGLLARAWLHSSEANNNGLDSARSDLDEAWEIAEHGPMPLFMADIHLYRARLFFRADPYPWKSPQTDLAEARQLIEKHGYWRRKGELEDAECVIGK